MEPLNRSRGSEPAYDTFVDEVEQDGDEEVHDYNDILNEIGCGPFQILVGVSLAFSTISAYITLYLLYILPKLLNCDGDWSHHEVNNQLGMIGIGGMVVGAILCGVIADIYGRKISLLVSNVLLAAFLIGCAFAPNIAGLAGMIFFVGAGAGGSLLQPMVVIVEIIPAKFRSIGVFSLFCIGTLGILVSIGIAIPALVKGWKVWLGLNSIFPLLAVIFTMCMPESPLFNLSLQESAKGAIGTLQLAVRLNRGNLPTGRLLSKEAENRGNPMGAFDAKIRKITVLLFLFFLVQGFVLSGTDMTEYSLKKSGGNCNKTTFIDTNDCTSTFDQTALVSEIGSQATALFAVIVGLVLSDTIGRKYSVSALSAVTAVLSFILIACMNVTIVKVLTSIVSIANEASIIIAMLYTVEIYDNEIRAIMLAVNISIFLLANLLGSVACYFLLQSSMVATLTFIGVVGIVGAILMAIISPDTKGKAIE